jgi:hypothetical protein
MVRVDQGEGRRWRYEKCWRVPMNPMEEEKRTARLSALQGKVRRARCSREGQKLGTLEDEREMQRATASDDAWRSVQQLQMRKSRVRMMEDEGSTESARLRWSGCLGFGSPTLF